MAREPKLLVAHHRPDARRQRWAGRGSRSAFGWQRRKVNHVDLSEGTTTRGVDSSTRRWAGFHGQPPATSSTPFTSSNRSNPLAFLLDGHAGRLVGPGPQPSKVRIGLLAGRSRWTVGVLLVPNVQQGNTLVTVGRRLDDGRCGRLCRQFGWRCGPHREERVAGTLAWLRHTPVASPRVLREKAALAGLNAAGGRGEDGDCRGSKRMSVWGRHRAPQFPVAWLFSTVRDPAQLPPQLNEML